MSDGGWMTFLQRFEPDMGFGRIFGHECMLRCGLSHMQVLVETSAKMTYEQTWFKSDACF
jgi:hypothetical protein